MASEAKTREAVMHEVAQALGLESVTLDDLRAIAALLDGAPVVASGNVTPDDLRDLVRDLRPVATEGGPLVYAWAVWRDEATGLYQRVRMHLPVSVALAHAVGPTPPLDGISRVVPQIERDLLSETLNRGARWT